MFIAKSCLYLANFFSPDKSIGHIRFVLFKVTETMQGPSVLIFFAMLFSSVVGLNGAGFVELGPT
jgi:hypothetical protein